MVNRWEDLEYNPETGVLRNSRLGKELGAYNGQGYLDVMIDGNRYKVHRVIWFLFYGEWPNCVIDHINHNRSDNRIENLRDVDHSTNSQNRKKNVGVHRSGRYWRVRRKVAGEYQYGGYFENREDAERKARELFQR